jgi:hypothetical protein
MLSRLGSKKDEKPRRAFDDIRNLERDESEDEDMARWNSRKNKAKVKTAERLDKENMQPTGNEKKAISADVSGDVKKRSFGEKIAVVLPSTIPTEPEPAVETSSITKESKDVASPNNDVTTFEELLKSGKTRLTPIKSSEKSKQSSPASSAFLSLSGGSQSGTVLFTPGVKTPTYEGKFSTPPSRSSTKATRPTFQESGAKADGKRDHSVARDLLLEEVDTSPVPAEEKNGAEEEYDYKPYEESDCASPDRDHKSSFVPESPADLARQMAVESLFSKVRHNRMKNVEAAFQEGCDPYAMDSNGNTLLHICAQNNLSKMANLCIHYGCDINAFNKKGRTPLDYCDTYNFTTMGDWLVTLGAENGVYDISYNHK